MRDILRNLTMSLATVMPGSKTTIDTLLANNGHLMHEIEWHTGCSLTILGSVPHQSIRITFQYMHINDGAEIARRILDCLNYGTWMPYPAYFYGYQLLHYFPVTWYHSDVYEDPDSDMAAFSKSLDNSPSYVSGYQIFNSETIDTTWSFSKLQKFLQCSH